VAASHETPDGVQFWRDVSPAVDERNEITARHRSALLALAGCRAPEAPPTIPLTRSIMIRSVS
jgi:hypothetical protein